MTRKCSSRFEMQMQHVACTLAELVVTRALTNRKRLGLRNVHIARRRVIEIVVIRLIDTEHCRLAFFENERSVRREAFACRPRDKVSSRIYTTEVGQPIGCFKNWSQTKLLLSNSSIGTCQAFTRHWS